MPNRVEELREKLAQTQKELAEAEEFDRRLGGNDARAVAEVLHAKECRWNHIDGCSWEYETWDGEKPAGNREHMRWYEKAVKLIDIAQAKGISVRDVLDLREI
mgnify:CR=1 FL=1